MAIGLSCLPPGHTSVTIDWPTACPVLYHRLPISICMTSVVQYCVKYNPPAGLATWDSNTGLILLFRPFLAYFKTILYWYKWHRLWKPSIRRDQPCTYLGNPPSMSGDIPQTVLGCSSEQTLTSGELRPTLKVSVLRLFEEYLQTYWTDFQDKYMADLVWFRAFRICFTYISTK